MVIFTSIDFFIFNVKETELNAYKNSVEQNTSLQFYYHG